MKLAEQIWGLVEAGYELQFHPALGGGVGLTVLQVGDVETGEIVASYAAEDEKNLVANINDAWRQR